MNARTTARRRAAARTRRVVNETVGFDQPEQWRVLFGGGPTEAGVSVTHKSALGYPPLWRATNIIANAVGKLPLYTYVRREQDGRERARTHPAYWLLRKKPNPLMTAGVFKRTLTLQAELDGNGYAWIERNGFEDPVHLWPLRPDCTYPVVEVVGLTRRLWYVTRDANGSERKLKPRDVLHIKGPSYDGYMGISVVDLMKEALGLGMAARQFATLFFGQGLNARGFLVVPRRLDDKELSKLREQWPKMEAGLKRAHLPVVLHGGMDFKSNQVDPDKAQALQTRQFELREVSNITGVPPHYLGDDSRTSYNSLEMESQSLLDNAIDPWLQVWEEEADDKLLSEEEKEQDTHYIEFLRDALLRVDAKTQTEINHRERESGIASVNDILKRKNRSPIGPEGDVRHIPANWMILTDKPAEDDPPAGSEQTDADAENRLSAIRQLAEHTAGLLVRSEADQVRRAAKRESNFVAWSEKYYGSHERKIAKALAPVLGVVTAESRTTRTAAGIAHDHVRASIAALLEAADGEPAGFVGRVEALTSQWETERAASLAAEIMGETDAATDLA